MPVTYTNRKGKTYFLCKGQTKTGKTRYYFAREPKGEPLEDIPDGYKINESVNGIISLAKDRPVLVQEDEIAVVETEVSRNPKSRRYRVSVKHDRIEIYEMIAPEAETMAGILDKYGFSPINAVAKMQDYLDGSSQFSAIMRFILVDKDEREFRGQRWCYSGSIDDWIDVDYGQIQDLASQMIHALGTDEFFELF